MSVAGAVPVPVSEAVWVPAASVRVKVPVRGPEAVGVKAIETVQPVLGASVGPQVLAVRWKSPVAEGVCRAAGGPPVLEMVMFWAGVVALMVVDGKVRVRGLRTMAAAGEAVPVSVTVAWPPGTLP